MQHDTLDNSTVQLLNAQGNPIAGTFSRNDSTTATSVTFTPLSRLAPGTYQMVVSTGARDLAGNGLAAQTTVALTHTPLSELTAANSGTTRLASTTSFTATILDGSNVSYAWAFGDGSTGSGANTSRIYAAVAGRKRSANWLGCGPYP